MKLSTAVAAASLLVPVACRVAPSAPRPYFATNITTLIKVFGTPLVVRNEPAIGGDTPPPKRPKPNPPDSPAPAEPGQPETSPQSEWDTYVCRGENLARACKLSPDKAESFMLPINSQFKGSLEEERKRWGYFESFDPDCDIEGNYYDIGRAYEELNIQEKDTQCFRVLHFNPEKVDDAGNEVEIKDQTYEAPGGTLRATGAHGTFGINVKEGALFFIDVASARLKAAELWGVTKPSSDQLPLLRQMSDLSWGFWHQAHGGANLGHITKFIVPQVINDITLRLIDTALETYDVPEGEERASEVPEWPGIMFDIETDAGKALLGSPNGIAAAYFLSQHKSEIGSNKHVKRIAIFRPDEDTDNDEPTIVYYVEDAPAPSLEDESPENPEQEDSGADAILTRRDLRLDTTSFPPSTDVMKLAEESDEVFWERHRCRGKKLDEASIRNRDDAVDFVKAISSEFDGTMEKELSTWGWQDLLGHSIQCFLADLEDALNPMGIDTNFKGKDTDGENECFVIEHKRGLRRATYKVDGKEYKQTGAYAHLGVNARDGVISFLNVKSAENAAQQNWRVANPPIDELPRLGRISDIAWAFWNRAHPDGAGLGNIKYFLVHDVINPGTRRLFRLALKSYQVPHGKQRPVFFPNWPGLDFAIETPEGQAMLGSPNGVAAGYFLLQHKDQLGGNKHIYKTTVWSDDDDWHMLLWVRDALPPPQGRAIGTGTEPTRDEDITGAFGRAGSIVKRSVDGKNFIREHRVLAKL